MLGNFPVGMSLTKKALQMTAVILAFELGFVAALAYSLFGTQRSLADEMAARSVTSHVHKLTNLIQTLTLGIITSNLGSGDLSRCKLPSDFKYFLVQIDAESRQLEWLLRNQQSEIKIVKQLTGTFSESLRIIDEIKREKSTDTLTQMRYELRMLSATRKITELSQHFVDKYRSIEDSAPKAIQRGWYTTFACLCLGAIVNIALAILFMVRFAKNITGRLNTIMENSVRLAANQELNSIVDGDDEITALDTMFHEMAGELKESERKQRAVLDNASEVIGSISADGKFTQMGEGSFKILGYEKEELIGARIQKILFEEDFEQVWSNLQTSSTAADNSTFEGRVKRGDGSVLDMHWSVHWSSVEKEFFCVLHDITERRSLERRKQEFVAMVSHDLRTPLTSVRGALTMLKEGVWNPASEKGKERIIESESTVDRLIGLVNDLLDIDKLEAGLMSLSIDQTSIGEIVTRSIANVEPVASNAKVLIETVLENADTVFRADEDRLVQVVINLLSNAIKFSPAGSIVSIKSRVEGGSAHIQVCDRGKGIPAEYHQSIFDRFAQVNTNDGKRGQGTGLGLPICKAIVEAHRGQITVVSEPGKGSVFSILLPISSDSSA